jgi:hypothetical protein
MTAAAPSSPIKLSWYPGLAVLFVVFVVIGVYSSRVTHDTTDYDQEQATERYAKLAKLRADDEKTLTTADWIDQSKGTVRLPIDEAIPEEIVALKAKPVQVGAPIPGATPTAPSTIPAAAANAAPAGAPAAAPSTNAAPVKPPAPAPGAPNK